jgi:hypothetical protein
MFDKKREKMIQEFTKMLNVKREAWMESSIWEAWIGCEICNERGKEAPCWGLDDCHGFYNGCGCIYCMELEKKLSS